MLLPNSHQRIQIFTETAYYEHARFHCDCRHTYPEEITYIWLKTQTNQTKPKPDYLYASVIM